MISLIWHRTHAAIAARGGRHHPPCHGQQQETSTRRRCAACTAQKVGVRMAASASSPTVRVSFARRRDRGAIARSCVGALGYMACAHTAFGVRFYTILHPRIPIA